MRLGWRMYLSIKRHDICTKCSRKFSHCRIRSLRTSNWHIDWFSILKRGNSSQWPQPASRRGRNKAILAFKTHRALDWHVKDSFFNTKLEDSHRVLARKGKLRTNYASETVDALPRIMSYLFNNYKLDNDIRPWRRYLDTSVEQQPFVGWDNWRLRQWGFGYCSISFRAFLSFDGQSTTNNCMESLIRHRNWGENSSTYSSHDIGYQEGRLHWNRCNRQH
jgi:hypothetical protein